MRTDCPGLLSLCYYSGNAFRHKTLLHFVPPPWSPARSEASLLPLYRLRMQQGMYAVVRCPSPSSVRASANSAQSDESANTAASPAGQVLPPEQRRIGHSGWTECKSHVGCALLVDAKHRQRRRRLQTRTIPVPEMQEPRHSDAEKGGLSSR